MKPGAPRCVYSYSSRPHPIGGTGISYPLVEVLAWLDENHFVIGRTDGSLTVYRWSKRDDWAVFPPVIWAQLVVPAVAHYQFVGPIIAQFRVTMVQPVAAGLFVSSNDERSIAVWQAHETLSQDGVRILTTLQYDSAVGVATSGAITQCAGALHLITGHINGSLLVWQVGAENTFNLVRQINVTSPTPLPQSSSCITAVKAWKPGSVATGSEDGDLCLVDAAAGRVVARMRYNPSAQIHQGINNINVYGDYLMATNNVYGGRDNNVWLFKIGDTAFQFLDAQSLIANRSAYMCVNYCVDQCVVDAAHYFFSVTDEGLWSGHVEGNRLVLLSREASVPTGLLGASMAYQPLSNALALGGVEVSVMSVAPWPPSVGQRG